MPGKALIWVGSSRADIRRFPAAARRTAGFQLWLLQQGLDPDDWKGMPAIGPGVREIRIHTRLEHRVLYAARFDEGIYVLHGFEKRSRKTPARDLRLARERLRVVLQERSARGRQA